MAIWIKRQVYILPMALVGILFDDRLVIVHNLLDSQRSMDQSGIFDNFAGQRVGHKKTVAFSSPPAKDDKVLSRGEMLKSVNAEKALGILIEVH